MNQLMNQECVCRTESATSSLLFVASRNSSKGVSSSQLVVREGLKKSIESVIMIIPRRTPPPPLVLKTVIALRFFFCEVF